jgi:copper homeostasis protein
MPPKRILLEIPVASVDDAIAAATGGADRLELNSAMRLGGLTPSLGLLDAVRKQIQLPIMVMIRPRPGGFCYSHSDLDVMRRDIDLALEHGADGIVFGILKGDGSIDASRCGELLRQIAGRVPAIFHRAFDLTPEPLSALEALIEIGFRRVMTSGQAPTAAKGADTIANLIEHAQGRIEILPAGGINAGNVADLLARTGCDQIHCGLRTRHRDRSGSVRPAISFGAMQLSADEFDATDGDAVRAVRRLLS